MTLPSTRPSPDIRVWVPVDPSQYAPATSTTTKARSSASYRMETQHCPPGTWRWTAGGASTDVAFDAASALIIRIEPAEVPADAREATFAEAAEKVAQAFRVETGVKVDEADEITMRFPEHRDAIGRLLEDWESRFSARVEVATEAVIAAYARVAPAKVHVTAIIAREHIIASCAPIEVCEGGMWTRNGHRARSTRRTALPPVFHGPRVFEITGAAEVEKKARATAQEIGEWLRNQYTREAAAAALLADGGDPCVFAPAVLETASR